MKIKSKQISYMVLFLVNGLYGMQVPKVGIEKILELTKSNNQAKIIMQLADVQRTITESDIFLASECLEQPLFFDETIDLTFCETLNRALFRLAQTTIAMDVEKVKIAKILTKIGANPSTEFSVEETLSIKYGAQYAQTSHSFKSDAKREAKGKLKEYLDSLK